MRRFVAVFFVFFTLSFGLAKADDARRTLTIKQARSVLAQMEPGAHIYGCRNSSDQVICKLWEPIEACSEGACAVFDAVWSQKVYWRDGRLMVTELIEAEIDY